MASSKFVNIKTEFGPVRGVQTSTVLGRDIVNFYGIPYMKPPLGKLRFLDPQPLEKWSQTFDASGAKPSYMGFNRMTMDVDGKEDAGTVSVSTPYLNPEKSLPVVCYIHGGGFQYPYGTIDMYGGDYLLQKDIIYVTINYRVGPIGFLSLKDPELNIPGNAGLKDQVLALKWVKKNIVSFGGDPNNVTVFGTSAGGASVHFLMISPQARGLFQKAVPMSGTSFIKTWTFSAKKDLTERLARLLGWDGIGGEKGILDVLENADVKDIVKFEAQLLTNEEMFIDHILFPFAPVIEPYETENSFLSKDPVLMARDAWSNEIDCVIGGTSLEGGLMTMFDIEGKMIEYIQDSKTFAPLLALGLEDQKNIANIGERLKKLYFGHDTPTVENRRQYFLFAGDLHFWDGIYRAVLSRVKSRGRGKTFFYRFNAQTAVSTLKNLIQLEEEGACHGDDIGHLFYANFPALKGPEIGSTEFDVIKKMVSIITSFAITGNPNSDHNEATWKPVDSINPLMCLNISNDNNEVIPLPEQERLKVWEEIINGADATGWMNLSNKL